MKTLSIWGNVKKQVEYYTINDISMVTTTKVKEVIVFQYNVQDKNKNSSKYNNHITM